MDIAERRDQHDRRIGVTHNPAPYETFPSRRPQLVGWSLALVGLSNLLLIVIAVRAGLPPIGLISLAALGLASWLLVVAEILSVRRFGTAGTTGTARGNGATPTAAYDRRGRL